ncbi:MAG: hypothetical protein OZ913_04310 [Ignavibacteriaceae bacterium]|jgi:hypothetical protein|nr:MAG: hypothetical protein EDM69_00555 [Chlorobiota bacterium]KXK02306.1 MAG: hypothetical protein UZ04_CHB001002013 [Chlorobi bacterium OLB4]MBV6398838.1 hypothetical protein [Ignavibacteria bacterium]MCC6884990.1 hypothetical protein [Ignavibacteriales bacterium]MCE7952219.1 hypothetical protein [Chlorobi bacterium CHB7]MDL1886224.1 hypothetical protein [Ignavibacteria bacterium CHB1]MEB2329505.1 hypothetical protein [Ignavibacteriaceae bacterium]OQY76945.1 MAG: hypothetical protein B6D4
MQTKLIIQVLFFISLLPAIVFAQRENHYDFRERVEKIRKEKMMEELNITEEKADQIINTGKKHRQKLRELSKRRDEIEKKMLTEIESDRLSNTIDEFLNIQSEITVNQENFLREIRALVTDKQFAKLIDFQHRFEENLRKEIRKRRWENGKRRRH